ncbi:hypothetical protein V8F06_000242 [Rhypophila decipiens]
MDPVKTARALSSRSSPPSPFPPLALSDFLSQQPFSSYDDDDRIDIGPEIYSAKDEGIPTRHLLPGKQQSLPNLELYGPRSSDIPQQPIPIQQHDASVVNWQYKRSQLTPSKNIGKKGEWIRGWSEAVGAHGDTAYCACSEPGNARKPGNRVLKRRVQEILQRKPPPQQAPIMQSELSICHNCSRPSSPAVIFPAAGTDDQMDPYEKKKFARLRSLFRLNTPRTTTPLTGPHLTPGGPLAHGTGSDETTSSDDTSNNARGPRGDGFIKRARKLNKRWRNPKN